jgi:hypothetical protein
VEGAVVGAKATIDLTDATVMLLDLRMDHDLMQHLPKIEVARCSCQSQQRHRMWKLSFYPKPKIQEW